jgi:hypothetical protein
VSEFRVEIELDQIQDEGTPIRIYQDDDAIWLDEVDAVELIAALNRAVGRVSQLREVLAK